MDRMPFEVFRALNDAQRAQDDLDAQAVIRCRKRFRKHPRVKNEGQELSPSERAILGAPKGARWR